MSYIIKLLTFLIGLPLNLLCKREKYYILLVDFDGEINSENIYSFYNYIKKQSNNKIRLEIIAIEQIKSIRNIKLKTKKLLLFYISLLKCDLLIIENNIPFQYTSYAVGSIKIQFWHGLNIKSIQKSLGIFNKIFRNYNYFLSPSKTHLEKTFQTSFYFKKSISANYPRNDYLLKNDMYVPINNRSKNYFDNALQKYKPNKTILYMPTFQNNSSQVPKLLDTKLLDYLISNKVLLFVKLHKYDKYLINNEEHFEYVEFIPNNMHIYPFMKHIDILISDYSSVINDFMITGKTILLFRPDKEYYSNNERQIILDHNFGLECKNTDSVIYEISKTICKEQEIIDYSFIMDEYKISCSPDSGSPKIWANILTEHKHLE